MDRARQRIISRDRIRTRIRRKVKGTAQRPRLAIFRSLKYIYVQAIDDVAGQTVAAASSYEPDLRAASGSNKKAAVEVGSRIAGRLKDRGIKSVVFDRGGYPYHGNVKALADAARESGLEF